jgi:general secretion pathway protein G
MNLKKTRAAFTLIEILLVIALIGLLAGVLITNTTGVFDQGQESAAKIFVRDTLKLALTRYRMDLGDYPSTTEGLVALVTPPANKADRWRGPYIEAPSGKLPLDPWGEPYRYRYPGTKNKTAYDLYSVGKDKAEGTEDDVGNW